MRRLLAVTVAAVAAAGLLAGCGEDKNWTKNCDTTANLVFECTAENRPQVSDISGELLDGGSYRVADDRGKVVVVNFWGSWCAPCRAEADDLEKTYQATKAKEVVFIGVNNRDDRDSAINFERGRVTYPSMFDPDAKLAIQFDPTQASTPGTLILDRQGRIAVAIRRATTLAELQPLVERVAAEALPTAPPATQKRTEGGA
ncbi:putative cytochrome c biogenesis protein [Actinoplanes missouriensis 431]|uniref:Putative cytochrome c biogenesis protein n=1 Tax=Actinoplanes missouriensis (strain ATCC 14538 / DSM 43046 / CBS 188.64 / JCM 3121 / NBRC 102363 / NCIMB 12654 / NRRL B-3342 / UNCC 431) TaxID=512565 RepID=I0GXC1_ACTM4|nr:putative cytochrome c biogenesis protein [Actinoplanes missouriensis 431]